MKIGKKAVDSVDIAKGLERDGIVVIPEYMSPETCDGLRASIERLLDRPDVERATHGAGHAALSTAGRTVVDVRGAGGRDHGMIDVFNVDAEVPALAEFKTDENIVAGINQQARSSVQPVNINAYVNSGVTTTRGFHSDADSEQYKSFVYLTDVERLEDGPFTYVRGSHAPGLPAVLLRRVLNKLRGRTPTDAVRVREDRLLHCLAKRGTLIVANQRGFHRGWPQAEDASRMLVTVSYKPAA